MPLPKIKLPELVCTSFILILFWSNACAQKYLDTVMKLSNLKQTDFVPTLENPVSRAKNYVYCSSLLYAWNELPNATKGDIRVDTNLVDLFLLNKSKSYKNTLTKNEYISKWKIDANKITVSAKFKKLLPFIKDFDAFENELTFNGEKTLSFGVIGKNSTVSNSVTILFYRDDNNFIIKISPKEISHEILLYKTESRFSTLGDIVEDVDQKRKNISQEILHWNYQSTDSDKLIIPKIQFNLKSDYPTLEGKEFNSNNHRFVTDHISQATAFVFNEKGAKIESTATGEVVFSEPMEGEVVKPKKLVFDKPFFLMLKRTDSKNPYLALWVSNIELLVPR